MRERKPFTSSRSDVSLRGSAHSEAARASFHPASRIGAHDADWQGIAWQRGLGSREPWVDLGVGIGAIESCFDVPRGNECSKRNPAYGRIAVARAKTSESLPHRPRGCGPSLTKRIEDV